jgi:hypothetical protein
MNKLQTISRNKYALAAFGLLISSVTGVLIHADANAAMSKVQLRFDRMAVNQTTTGTVCASPNTVGTETSVSVTFPTGFSVSSTTANWSTSTTNLAWPTNAGVATAWPGIGATATSATGQTVTWTSGDLTVGTLYCFNWTTATALTQPGSATASELGSVVTNIDATGGGYATATVAANADQIQVTASVPASFAFSLNNNSSAITGLTTGTVGTSGTTVASISTNSKSGWNVWARDTNGTLTSALNAYSINSTTPGTNSTLSAGTEGYNMGVVGSNAGGTGSLTVAAPYVGGSTGKGSGLDATMRLIGGSTGQAAGSTLTMTNNAAISALTPAASDYTDTITVVGAGLF